MKIRNGITNFSSNKNQSGFSLVELMIVVAIIGILSSIAVPQFQKFIFKARQTEARTGLSAIYSGEKAFYGEWSQYDTGFSTIGFKPEGDFYYNMGFNGPIDAANDSATSDTVYNICTTAGASGTGGGGQNADSVSAAVCKDSTAGAAIDAGNKVVNSSTSGNTFYAGAYAIGINNGDTHNDYVGLTDEKIFKFSRGYIGR